MDRISPQLSCTVSKKDKNYLEKLALDIANHRKKIFTISEAIRLLIYYGKIHHESILELSIEGKKLK